MDNDKLLWHRIKLIALVAVFLAPFIGGWLALYVFEIKPESTNYGSLIQPVKKIQWIELESLNGNYYENGFGKKWTFLMFIQGDCGQQCRSNLFYIRQIKTLLGRDTDRLQNVLISTGPVETELKKFLNDYPNLIVIKNQNNANLLSQFQTFSPEPVGSSARLYLVDPDQNLMMHYGAEIDHYKVLEDIKKLLKLSQIG